MSVFLYFLLTSMSICGATTPPSLAQKAQLPIPMFLQYPQKIITKFV